MTDWRVEAADWLDSQADIMEQEGSEHGAELARQLAEDLRRWVRIDKEATDGQIGDNKTSR